MIKILKNSGLSAYNRLRHSERQRRRQKQMLQQRQKQQLQLHRSDGSISADKFADSSRRALHVNNNNGVTKNKLKAHHRVRKFPNEVVAMTMNRSCAAILFCNFFFHFSETMQNSISVIELEWMATYSELCEDLELFKIPNFSVVPTLLL